MIDRKMVVEIAVMTVLTCILLEFVLVFTHLERTFVPDWVDAHGNHYPPGTFGDNEWYDRYSFYAFDPVLGWKFKSNNTFTYFDPQGELTSSFTSTNDGFRVSASGLSNGQKLLFLGDSFMFGQGVNDSDTIPSYVARESGAQVSNYGVIGYGTDQELLLEKSLLPEGQYNATVLTLFLGNDFEDNFVPANTTCARKTFFTLENGTLVQHLLECKNPHGLSKTAFVVSNAYSSTARVAYYLLRKKYVPSPDECTVVQAKIDLMLALLEETNRVSLENHAPLYVFLIPSKERFVKGNSSFCESRELAYVDALREFSNRTGVRMYDPTEFFKSSPQGGKELYFATDLHFNPQGNRAMAEYILATLNQGPRQ